MLQFKKDLQERKSDDGAVPNAFPSAIKLGRGDCRQAGLISNMMKGFEDYDEEQVDLIAPARTEPAFMTPTECEEKAKTYSNALGFRTVVRPWRTEENSCTIFFPENSPELLPGTCTKSFLTNGAPLGPCARSFPRDPDRDRDAPAKDKGPFYDFYDYYYYFSSSAANLAVPGPYKIDYASWAFSGYYFFHTCYKFEESTADYALTNSRYSCEEGFGYEPIPSKEECQAAGDALGLDLTVRETSDEKDPKGCFLFGEVCAAQFSDTCAYNGGALRWNGDSGTTAGTRKNRNAICKNVKKQA